MKHIPAFFLSLSTLLLANTACLSQDAYAEAYNEYLHGDLNMSIHLFTKAIEKKQQTANAYMYRAAAKILLKRFPAALSDLDSAGKLDPSIEKLPFYYGRCYMMNEVYDTAIRYYDQAIARNPRHAAAYDERAVSRGMLKDYKGAIQDEDQAIKWDSTQEIYFTDRGFAWAQLQQYEKAIKDYDRSLSMEPNQKAYADRGYAYSRLGRQERAIEDYTKAIEMFPGDYEIYYRRGISYKALGRQKEACRDFTQSKELSNYAPAAEELKKSGCP